MAVQSPSPRFQTDVTGQGFDVAGGAAALPVAVDVERLNGIVDVAFVIEKFAGRIGLVAILTERPDGQGFLPAGSSEAVMNEFFHAARLETSPPCR